MKTLSEDRSFLAQPGGAEDWRLVVLFDAAREAGILDALPGAPVEVASHLGLEEHAVVVVLEALAVFGVVESNGTGRFSAGPQAPSPEESAILTHHARSLRRWSGSLPERLAGVVPAATPRNSPELWLDALAVNARRSAPASVDACLAILPGASSVLDLGGGHGEYSLEFARRGLAVTMQDRPGMMSVVRARGVLAAAGVELFTGDLFDALPGGTFDLIFCAGVTNGLSRERNVALYQAVQPSLAPGGRFVIQSFMRDQHQMAALFGVQMFLGGNGGDAHPETSYRAWLAEAGFGQVDMVDVEVGRRTLLFAATEASAARPG